MPKLPIPCLDPGLKRDTFTYDPAGSKRILKSDGHCPATNGMME
jgi:hypothetical protein